MKDVIVTVVVAIVLAIVFLYLLLGFAFSGWGDRSPQGSTSAISGRLPRETFVDSSGALAELTDSMRRGTSDGR